ncbi:MAG: lysophospholipid acyltransferase family protein [Rhodobiaceae bacterium]|nr:lysophospholipid acyltransferase family protein [Rhodobiaceae bacterium]MCC0048996.1 DUF374 domain-containing protein [Rhodobiaceae bacterium]
MLKKLSRHPVFQQFVGSSIAAYLRLVHLTSRYTIDPPDLYEDFFRDKPFIFTMWHGEHYISPFVKMMWKRKKQNAHEYKPDAIVVEALISRHRDGEINAIAASKLGIGSIRGSGAHDQGFRRKGGVPAFREMLARLEAGSIVALTADVPKVSRVAGQGIVRLAAHSGRAIYPVAIVTSRRRHMNNWDRSVINLPFSRIVIAGRPAIWVDRDSDEETLEEKRLLVQSELNAVTERAYALADGKQ